MANATARVNRTYRDYKSNKFAHSWNTLSTPLNTFVGGMVGLNAGYLAKFDDTASMKFMGVLLEDHGNVVLPWTGVNSATAPDPSLFIDFVQPVSFELAITSVAITDIGRRVYALDDQTGTLDPSTTTYGNLIGVVKDLVYATNQSSPIANLALVAPVYDIPAGNQLQILTTAAPAVQVKASTVVLNKAGVIAATLALPTTGVHDGMTMRFVSVTAQAHTVTTTSGYNGSGSGIATWAAAKGNGMEIIAFGGVWYANFLTGVTLS